jgi:hypothetical protein
MMVDLSIRNNTMKPIYLLKARDFRLQSIILDSVGDTLRFMNLYSQCYSLEMEHDSLSQLILLPPQREIKYPTSTLWGLNWLNFPNGMYKIRILYSYKLPEVMFYQIRKSDFLNHLRAVQGKYKSTNTYYFLNEVSHRTN